MFPNELIKLASVKRCIVYLSKTHKIITIFAENCHDLMNYVEMVNEKTEGEYSLQGSITKGQEQFMATMMKS